MSDLGGHDMPTLLEAFESRANDKRPTVFIAYTVKGFGLPLQGHKDNHAGLMTETQMSAFRAANGVREGHEWDKFEGAGASRRRDRGISEASAFRARRQAQAGRADRSRSRPPCPSPRPKA